MYQNNPYFISKSHYFYKKRIISKVPTTNFHSLISCFFSQKRGPYSSCLVFPECFHVLSCLYNPGNVFFSPLCASFFDCELLHIPLCYSLLLTDQKNKIYCFRSQISFISVVILAVKPLLYLMLQNTPSFSSVNLSFRPTRTDVTLTITWQQIVGTARI